MAARGTRKTSRNARVAAKTRKPAATKPTAAKSAIKNVKATKRVASAPRIENAKTNQTAKSRTVVAKASVPMPPADDLIWWHYCVVPTGVRPVESVRGTGFRRATEQLVGKGISDHDIIGFRSNDDVGEIDLDDDSHQVPVKDVGSFVRFAGPRVVQAWLGAIVVVEKDASLMGSTVTVATWKAMATRTKATEVEFRAFELLRLPPDAAMDRAWSEQDHSRWRYALALAQGKPLMAKLWGGGVHQRAK